MSTEDMLGRGLRSIVGEAVQDVFKALIDQGFVVAAKHDEEAVKTPVREYMTETEVEARYSIPRKTLSYWRSEGRGPKYSKPGMRILYRKADVDAFMAKYTVRTVDDDQPVRRR